MIKRKEAPGRGVQETKPRGRKKIVAPKPIGICPHCGRIDQPALARSPGCCGDCQLAWESFTRNKTISTAAAALSYITQGPRWLKLNEFWRTGETDTHAAHGVLKICRHCLRTSVPAAKDSKTVCSSCRSLSMKYYNTPSTKNALLVLTNMKCGGTYDKAMQAMRERLESGELSEEQIKEYREVQLNDRTLDNM